MKEITLTFSLDEINTVLEALGGKSYVSVFALIEKIQAQAQAQLANSEASEEQKA
ncbi:hypothetical protein SAMN05216490_2547 [Mucilaginibacter mallensis]|uniref:Uncharacterized protein n=1 Tax=Mucilaginibacter mallensis TaxID=652787 RepID=A0A1H1XUA3_MUCMA|nr:hypothetical protein [Mucilaginibacter mallensis]SDT12775.1 hypothetical protein SAMN05216490_2547 [Mucilaginibacter mallensis]